MADLVLRPAGVCLQCGEKIVKADVGRQLGDADCRPSARAQAKDNHRPRDSIREGFSLKAFFPARLFLNLRPFPLAPLLRPLPVAKVM